MRVREERDNTSRGCWIKHNWAKEMDDEGRCGDFHHCCLRACMYSTRSHTRARCRHITWTCINTCIDSTTLDFTSDHDHQGNYHNHLHIVCRLEQAVPTYGWVSVVWAVQFLPLSSTGDQLVQASSYNISVIRLGKWRHLTRLQLRLNPHGLVCKLHCSHKQSHCNKATQEGLWLWKS